MKTSKTSFARCKSLVVIVPIAVACSIVLSVRAQTANTYRQDRILVKPLSNQITNLHATLGSTVMRT